MTSKSDPATGAVVLITGGNGAIACAAGRGFLTASDDARVRLGVRRRRETAMALAAEFPERCRLVDLDVASREAWESAVGGILAENGRLDVLVNAAGFHRDSLLASMDDETWNAVLESNLTGTFFGCRAVMRAMMGQRFGRIVNVASLSALLAPAGQTNYAAAKAAVVAMTQSLAKEAARAGITVNAICPGYIESDATAGIPDDRRRELLRSIPVRRFGRPEEVAAAIQFLASPAASYITGAVLKIDGGIF